MLRRWLLLTASLTSLAFASEPQISSVAALPSQNSLLTVSGQSRTPIIPVSEPITFVPVTATAQPFVETLTCKLRSAKEQRMFKLISFQATSIPATTIPSARPTLFGTNTPGQWPRPHHKLDIPGSPLYLTILDYGLPVDPGLKEDVISNLALIVADVDRGGDPDQVLSTVTYTKGLVSFQIAHRIPGNPYGVERKEVLLVLETVGGLIVSDGPRRIQTAFISRGHLLVGKFALDLTVPGSFGVSQSPQNSSTAIPR